MIYFYELRAAVCINSIEKMFGFVSSFFSYREEHLFPISLVRKNEKQIFYLFTRKYSFNETHYLSESD